MENFKSVLNFETYIVNKIEFVRNNDYSEEEKNVEVKLSIIPKTIIDDGKMTVNLITEIFKDAKKNNYPFELKLDVTGKFYTEGEELEKFKANAIAIMYPYIRAIVTTYTASANITPLILPPINVRALLEQQ